MHKLKIIQKLFQNDCLLLRKQVRTWTPLPAADRQPDMNVIKESVPDVHITKAERWNIVGSFKDIYHKYWTNTKEDLVTFPAMNAFGLTLIIFHYTQHLATMTKVAQKTANNNTWLLLTTQDDLKACTDEIAKLHEQLAKKSPGTEETLTPQLKQAQSEAELAQNRLSHV